MGPEWITAFAAVAGLLTGAIAVYVHMRVDIASLAGRIDALDMEIARLVRQQSRLENLIVALIGKGHFTLPELRDDA